MRSVLVLSEEFLKQINEPRSRLATDCLAYRKGQITKSELMARLPHVAILGDSVCMNIYISSMLTTFWRARRCGGKNWFLETDMSSASINSVSKRLAAFTPFVANEYAGVGALVDHERERQNPFRRILGTRNFSGQVSRLLAPRRFPDLILISIGHNNVDWAWECSSTELEQPENRLQHQSNAFRDNFMRQIRRLLERARVERHRVAILIYGLINFESFFKARERAENLRGQNPAFYPHLETTYKYFTSFRPAYRRNLVRLANMMNKGLDEMVIELSREHSSIDHVQLRYSDALATADLSRVELVHAIDAWHPSAAGHNVLAEAAFSDLGPSLEFLGIKPGSDR